MKLKEGDRVVHKEYGVGTITQIFKFGNGNANERRSRFPYLVKFDSGYNEQFLLGELKLLSEVKIETA